MNKKIIFILLTTLIVLTFKTNSSYSTPIKYDENYWTPERMKRARAKPLINKNINKRTRSDVKTIRNITDTSKYPNYMKPFERKYDINNNDIITKRDVNQWATGLLLMSKNGEEFSCTACVINTSDGNIGITAAHCLYDFDNSEYYENIIFSPGFDNGQDGPYGQIPVSNYIVASRFFYENRNEYDYGMIKFNFNFNGNPLKYYTGAFGWKFYPGNNIPTTIRGYPNGGKLENCPNDGIHLCTWQGETILESDFYIIKDLELGNGASGSPFIMDVDPVTNIGLIYSNYASFDELTDNGLGPIYDPVEFLALISFLETA